MKSITKKQWIKFAVAAFLYMMFALWMENAWLLFGLVVIVDILHASSKSVGCD